jgi:hypothetical protein
MAGPLALESQWRGAAAAAARLAGYLGGVDCGSLGGAGPGLGRLNKA